MNGQAQARTGALVGLRVIDLGQMVSASAAATLLADYGADVVKVEHPRGDPIRKLAPHKDGVPLWYKVNGRNKRTIALDLKTDADRDTFLGLVATADVVVENFVPGTMARLGLSYETLSAANPGLIMLSVSAYGSDGPLSAGRGFGRTAEAFSGMAYITGFPDRAPLHSGFPIADEVTGVLGAAGILAAIYERDRNPRHVGQHLDLGLYETPFRLMEFLVVAYDQLGTVIERTGTEVPYVSPVGTWKTADGKWLSFTGSTQVVVERLFRAIGMADLIDDLRFETNQARIRNRDELNTILSGWLLAQTMDDVVRRFAEHDVPFSPVMSIADIFEHPQYQARRNIVTVEDDDLGPLRMQSVIPKFSRTPGAVRNAGHAVDADRESVLHDWLGQDSGASSSADVTADSGVAAGLHD